MEIERGECVVVDWDDAFEGERFLRTERSGNSSIYLS